MLNRKLTWAFLSALCLILGAAVFFGCSQATGVDPAEERLAASVGANPYPAGKWKGTSFDEDFNITTYDLSYLVYGTTVYAGDVVDVVDDTASTDSGIIYIQYTDAPYGIVGNYYAVRWERYDPVGHKVWLSGCSDADGKPTLKEAETTYNEASKDTYFKYGSDFGASRNGERVAPPTRPNEKPPYLKYLEEKTGLIIVK